MSIPTMKKISIPVGIIFLIFSLACFSVDMTAHADKLRKAVVAGSFYPGTGPELTALIKQLVNRVKPVQIEHHPDTSLKALIIPHAGYIYAGWTAVHISQVLRKNQFNRVIVMGPDHRVGFQGGAISNVSAYETPLGLIRLDERAALLRRYHRMFHADPVSDRLEHSVEVVLPYLQYFLGEFKLIPIVLGQGEHLGERVSDVLDPLLDQNTLLVASSDLSHYLPYSEAVVRDRKTIHMILNLETEKLKKRQNAACGKIPILIVVNMARRHNWKPVLLHYSNSGDTAGDHSRVVGYTAIAFFGGTSMQNTMDSPRSLNAHQGEILVKLARQTLAKRLNTKSVKIDPDALKDPAFQEHRGTFVTLTVHKQLRGCIGNLDSTESILDGIRRNAVNAGFHDPRFPPLIADELDEVDIEVSILAEPKPLEYTDSKDLLSKLHVGEDGVILKKGPFSATFLPQVWAQLPRPEDFLSHLCMKAGLSSDAWRKNHLEIMTYQVQYFEEKK